MEGSANAVHDDTRQIIENATQPIFFMDLGRHYLVLEPKRSTHYARVVDRQRSSRFCCRYVLTAGGWAPTLANTQILLDALFCRPQGRIGLLAPCTARLCFFSQHGLAIVNT